MNTNSIARNLRRSLATIPEGEVFDYRRFTIGDNEEIAITKELSRLAQSGKIVRMDKGKYYKPRETRFGTLRPAETQVVKTLTMKNGRPVGYLTGTALYNQLGLTTQVSNTLTIARNSRLPIKELNGYKIRFITKTFRFRKKDIALIQLLDALCDIKSIPDTSVSKAIKILVGLMRKLSEDKLKRMSKLATDRNPATRALVGAIIEFYFPSVSVSHLLKSLNPLSKYELGITDASLPNKSKWYIE
jgi:Family of unknown function (DUF6088)